MPIWNSLIKPVSDLFIKGLDIVDDLVPDKDLAMKVKAGLKEKVLEIAHSEFTTLIQAQSSIITTEAKGDSWLQRNWRPLLMVEFGTIILNNYILAPYIGALAGPEYKIMLEIPPDMWGLLKLGVSGYVAGRSLEKIADGTGVRGMINKVMGGK